MDEVWGERFGNHQEKSFPKPVHLRSGRISEWNGKISEKRGGEGRGRHEGGRLKFLRREEGGAHRAQESGPVTWGCTEEGTGGEEKTNSLRRSTRGKGGLNCNSLGLKPGAIRKNPAKVDRAG